MKTYILAGLVVLAAITCTVTCANRCREKRHEMRDRGEQISIIVREIRHCSYLFEKSIKKARKDIEKLNLRMDSLEQNLTYPEDRSYHDEYDYELDN